MPRIVVHYRKMTPDFQIAVGPFGYFPLTRAEACLPLRFAFEILFPLFCAFDVAFHFSRTDTAYAQFPEAGVVHMVNIADDLVTAHLAYARRCSQIGFRYIFTVPKIFTAPRVFRLLHGVRLFFFFRMRLGHFRKCLKGFGLLADVRCRRLFKNR